MNVERNRFRCEIHCECKMDADGAGFGHSQSDGNERMSMSRNWHMKKYNRKFEPFRHMLGALG